MTPINLKQKQTIVPCGKCPQCAARRTSAWSFRLMQENKVSDSSHFITLTYGDKNLNYSKTGYAQLCKRDVQLFIKRLRKAHTNARPIKYFAVGEYGEKTWRPHYHIILFNAQIELIQTAWAMGHCHYGQLSEASVGYTLKYISKPKPSRYALRGRQQQFSLQSKGLGKNYLTKPMVRWHKLDIPTRAYCNLTDGKKITMPRYYKEKIYTNDEKLRIHTEHLKKLEIEHLAFMQGDFDKKLYNLQQGILAAKNQQKFINQKQLLL
jgi:hypothetical protein